jgi:YggT family protein
MTDYERTTIRDTDPVDEPVVARDGYDDGPRTRDVYDDRVRTREVYDDRPVERDVTYRSGPSAGEVIRRVVMLLFGVLQALLIIRILLLLLVANTGNDIVSLILGITNPFVEPFRGMFQLDRVTAGRSALDVAAIVALIAWTLIEALVVALLSLGAGRGEDATP